MFSCSGQLSLSGERKLRCNKFCNDQDNYQEEQGREDNLNSSPSQLLQVFRKLGQPAAKHFLSLINSKYVLNLV